MRSVYGPAWRCYRKLLPPLAAVAFGLELLRLLLPDSGSTGDFAAHAVIAYMMHRHILFGELDSAFAEKASLPQKPALGWFMLATGAMLLLTLFTGIAVAAWLQDSGLAHGDLGTVVFAATFLAYLVGLILFGSALPAAAAGDRFGVIRTLRRTRTTALSIAGGLLVGPAPFYVAFFTALDFVERFVTSLDAGIVAEIAFGAVLRMGSFFGTALAVAVLCRAYRRIIPEGGPSAHTAAA